MEIGVGEGDLSNLLLRKGLAGIGFDLNPKACRRNRRQIADYIQLKRYEVLEQDFLTGELDRKADVIVCYMVIEHLEIERVDRLLARAASSLTP